MSLGCKKRSFLLSDESGRLLTSIRGQGQSAYGMSWAHAMYSKEGDKVKVNVGFPERKVDGGNLSSSSITKLTNYSFADHLTLEREIHILEGGDCGV